MAWPLFYGALGALTTGFTAEHIGIARSGFIYRISQVLIPVNWSTGCVAKENTDDGGAGRSLDDICDGMAFSGEIITTKSICHDPFLKLFIKVLSACLPC